MACLLVSLNISSLDTGDATGNTNPLWNSRVFVDYNDCSGNPQTQSFLTGVHEICVDSNSYPPTLYYYKNDTVFTANNSSFSNDGTQCTATNKFNKCCEQGGTVYETQSGFQYNLGNVYNDGTDCWIAVLNDFIATSVVNDTNSWVEAPSCEYGECPVCPSPSPTPSETPTPTETPSPTPTPSETPSETPSPTP